MLSKQDTKQTKHLVHGPQREKQQKQLHDKDKQLETILQNARQHQAEVAEAKHSEEHSAIRLWFSHLILPRLFAGRTLDGNVSWIHRVLLSEKPVT